MASMNVAGSEICEIEAPSAPAANADSAPKRQRQHFIVLRMIGRRHLATLPDETYMMTQAMTTCGDQ